LVSLSKGPLTAESAAPAISSIINYHKALAGENVSLIVVPVPTKAEIYPDKLVAGAKPTELAGHEIEFIAGLKAGGVNVVDLAKAYHARRQADHSTPLYCERDAHWSPAGIAIATDLILAEIKDKSWFGTPKELSAPESLQITGDLMTTPETQALGVEKISIQRTKEIVPPSTTTSPALLMGDSHTMVFSTGANAGFHCQGAGILDLLQAKTGTPFLLFANNNGGTDTARRQLALQAVPKPEFWKDKKVVIWCFSLREVTEKKWKDFPIKKN
jgi:alginate O-acetyltransferase complex protein AlgJ